jgi:hypothetical protein
MSDDQVVLCSRCQQGEAQSPHTCPYAEEIADDRETLCTCCQECETQCCQDI